MNDICGDNRFEIIAKAKEDLLKRTNIHTNEDEMKVLDDFLFRCWQMRWLDRYAEIDEFKEGDKCVNNYPKSQYINDKSIIEEAKKYYKGDIRCYNAFLHGVEFIENNLWISVKDDLPYNHKELLYNNYTTKFVLVLCNSYSEVRYMSKLSNGDWYWIHSANVTHWMPIPKLENYNNN